jgi:hypothetical protein
MPEFEDLAAGLRAWVRGSADPEVAAVELLIWHEHWLRRASFYQECVKHFTEDDSYGIVWPLARAFADRVIAGGLGTPRASRSEASILDIAVVLGEDRFHLTNLGATHRRSVGNVFLAALGLGELEMPDA